MGGLLGERHSLLLILKGGLRGEEPFHSSFWASNWMNSSFIHPYRVGSGAKISFPHPYGWAAGRRGVNVDRMIILETL